MTSADPHGGLGFTGDDAFGAAVEEFRDLLATVFGSEAEQGEVVRLYAAYATVLQDALRAPAVGTLAAERYEAYARAVAEAFSSEDARARLQDAYRSYVAAVKAAWAATDEAALGPEDLASIAEEMSWVAGVALAVRQISGTAG